MKRGKTRVIKSQFVLVLLLVQNVHVARIFSKPNTQCCKETQSSSGLHSTLYWKLLWLARPLSSFFRTKMRSFSKCYGPKVCTKRLTFLRTNIIFKPGCDNFFVFLKPLDVCLCTLDGLFTSILACTCLRTVKECLHLQGILKTLLLITHQSALFLINLSTN